VLEAAIDIDPSRAMRINVRYNGQAANAGDKRSVMASLFVRF
jgi:hypothetical protein